MLGIERGKERIGSNPELASRIAERLGCDLADVTFRGSPGEIYCRYEDSVRGAEVFIVQTGSQPVDTLRY